MRVNKKRERHARSRFQRALRSLPEEENQEKAQELQAEGERGILSFRKSVLQRMRRAISWGIGNRAFWPFLHLLQVPWSQEAYVQGESDKEGRSGDDCFIGVSQDPVR